MSAEQAFTALSCVILGSFGLMLVELSLSTEGRGGLEERLEALKEAVAADPAQKVTRQALERVESLKLGAIHEQSLEVLLRGFASWTCDA